jgi:predicted ATPase
MVTLNRIEIEGFKSIRKLDLELRPLNVLIGANGSGKSNFVSVFKLLNQIPRRQLQLYVAKSGGADTLLHFGHKTTNGMRIRLSLSENYDYELFLFLGAPDSLLLSEKHWSGGELLDHSIGPINKSVENMALESVVDLSTTKTQKHLQETLANLTVYHFLDTSESARLKTTGYIGDNIALKADAANLAAYLYLLRERHSFHYERIAATIRLVAPFFDDFVLRPNPLNPDTIRLEWREKGSDLIFHAHMLSDGTLRFICLATLLLQPQPPALILIDEPELGLHPHAINLLAAMLQSVATQTQVIISTQSVTLVNQFEPEDIIVVDKVAGQSHFNRLREQGLESWLEDYRLGELWEKNALSLDMLPSGNP